MMPDQSKKYLFLGVGGMGMAPLACWMSQAGYSVTGYDSSLQERVRLQLDSAGIELVDFLFEEHFQSFDVVVHSSALKQGNPLFDLAADLGQQCVRRGELLAEIGAGKKFIAISGSHGKTTTSGMIAYGIHLLGLEVNYILGGLSADEDIAPSRFVENEWMVAEVDESDGTIDGFCPEHSVILNIDWDHADHYTTRADLVSAFARLADRTRSRIWMPDDLQVDFAESEKVHRYPVEDHGMAHSGLNVGNWSAAMTVLRFFNADIEVGVLNDFPGMARRQGVLWEEPNLTVMEDYAHHPTEIEALLADLRNRAVGKRLHVVFQPHRFTRTRQFREDFASSLSSADQVWLLPVYGAHEAVLDGGGLEDLIETFGNAVPRVLEMGLGGISEVCAAAREEPTFLTFVGAGDIEQIAGACVSTLKEGEDAFLAYVRERTSPDCVLSSSEPMAKKTTIRVGGSARFYAEPANRADLQILLRAADLFGVSTFCLGRGSNLVVADDGFDGLVIRFSAKEWRRIETLSEGRIWVAAGCRLKEICGYAARAGLSGFEFLEGIPGSVGGSLRMNAGAMGSWIFDVVERVQLIDEGGIYRDLGRDAFHFGYRKVEEISRGVALGAILRAATIGEETAIRVQIDSYANSRKESQPRGASAGCIFKNPEGNYAGRLIDEHGLKGMRVGGAEVSEVHGNFIVNSGDATAADVIELVRQVRARIKSDSGYELEPEVLLVGQSWDDVLERSDNG